MTLDPTKSALYCQGTFSTPDPDQQQIEAMVAAAGDINRSGFGTVILGQWHVHADGSVFYNDAPLDSVIQALKVIPTALKLGGSVRKVLLTFGPFGSDFQGIQDNLAQFKQTMAGVRAMTDIDGFDWDLEEDYEQYTDLLVDLTQWANGLGLTVTAAPYQDSSFWTTVLKRTNTGGAAGFAWWNLQLYSGVPVYGDWVKLLQGLVPSPEAFLTAGYSVSQGSIQSSPGQVQSALTRLRASHPGLDGAFLWRYEDIAAAGYTAAQYAAAIAAGLGGPGAGAEGVEVPLPA